jgi:hypothetical protein
VVVVVVVVLLLLEERLQGEAVQQCNSAACRPAAKLIISMLESQNGQNLSFFGESRRWRAESECVFWVTCGP